MWMKKIKETYIVYDHQGYPNYFTVIWKTKPANSALPLLKVNAKIRVTKIKYIADTGADILIFSLSLPGGEHVPCHGQVKLEVQKTN